MIQHVYSISDAATVTACGVALVWSILLRKEPLVALGCLLALIVALVGAPSEVVDEFLLYKKVVLVDPDYEMEEGDDARSLGTDMTVDLSCEDEFYWVMQELKQRASSKRG